MLVLNLFIIKTRMVKLQSNKVQKLIERPYLLTKNVHIFKGSKLPVPTCSIFFGLHVLGSKLN